MAKHMYLIVSLIVMIFAFQNCTHTNFSDDNHKSSGPVVTSVTSENSGNAGGYTGKVYAHRMPGELCADGSDLIGLVQQTNLGYFKTRVDCFDLKTPIQTDVQTSATDPNAVVVDGTTFSADPTAAIQVYRLFNSTLGRHWYSSDAGLVLSQLTQAGWQVENVAFKVYQSQAAASGLVALTLMTNPQTSTQIFAADASAISTLQAAGFSSQLTVGFVPLAMSTNGNALVQSAHNSDSSDYYYTADFAEYINVVSNTSFSNSDAPTFRTAQ